MGCADGLRFRLPPHRYSIPSPSFQRRLEAFYNSEAGHPVTLSLGFALSPDCSPTRRAFRPPAGGRVTFLCLSKEEVTKRKDTPESAPLRVRERVTGFFDSTSCAGEKLAGIRASHPSGFPSPVRRALRGPGLRARAARGARTSCCRFAPVEQQRRSAIRFFSSLFVLPRVRALRARGPLMR